MPEMSLHNQLKDKIRLPRDLLEAEVWGFKADIIRGDQVIEIQTGNFPAIRSKITRLLKGYSVTLIYPLTEHRVITRLDGEKQSKRSSPKRGRIEELFNELIYMPTIVLNQRFRLEVFFIWEEEILKNDGEGSWRRRKWSIEDRKLIKVTDIRIFEKPTDYLELLPNGMPQDFGVKDLQKASGISPVLARKMLYTLSKMGLLVEVGKKDRGKIYHIR